MYLEVVSFPAERESHGQQFVVATDQGLPGGMTYDLSGKHQDPAIEHGWLDLRQKGPFTYIMYICIQVCVRGRCREERMEKTLSKLSIRMYVYTYMYRHEYTVCTYMYIHVHVNKNQKQNSDYRAIICIQICVIILHTDYDYFASDKYSIVLQMHKIYILKFCMKKTEKHSLNFHT